MLFSRRLAPLLRQLRARRRSLLVTSLAIVLGLLTWDAAKQDLTGPPPSYLLLDRHGHFIAELPTTGGEVGYWPLAQLPPRVVAATLALEDKRFDTHPGFDLLAVARALYQNVAQGKRVSGASTIAMQVARMLHPGERTYWHKLTQAWHALVLTARFGRGEILSAYLRLVPYGNRVHGIGYAARRYLDKPVADLSWAEIALLSAIPQAPSLMNPYHEEGRRRAVARGLGMLAKLSATGLLQPAEYELAQQQIRELRLPPLPPRPAHAIHAMFKVAQVLRAGERRGGPEPYRVITTLDLELQEAVTEIADAALDEWRTQGVGNAAVVLLDRASNGVLAWVGAANYFDKDQAGALDFARTPRSPGSALKPFFYAQAFERGLITPATILDDLPSLTEGIVNADKEYLGPLLPRQALANSRNVPVARLLNDIGLNEGYGFLHELGLHQNERSAAHFGLGLVIGTLPVTLEHLVQAYSVFANDGDWRSLKFVQDQPMESRQLLSPGVARLISLQLSDPGARLPTFARMGSTEYAFPVALKTGTSQGLRDAWTVAYTRRYLIGVWVGHPDARPMRGVTGASHAAEVVRRVLKQLHREERTGSADLSFPRPQGYVSKPICALSGRLATPDCDLAFEEWFKPGQEPMQEDNVHVRMAVDVRTGLLANSATPPAYVEQRHFINLPPRYAQWAAQAGLPRPPDSVSTGASTFAYQPARRASELQPSGAAIEASLRVVSPRDGVTLVRDPTVPANHNTIAFQLEVDPAVPQVLWMVDGQPYKLASYPYTVRWQLRAGEHVVHAAMPFTRNRSAPVRIRVE